MLHQVLNGNIWLDTDIFGLDVLEVCFVHGTYIAPSESLRSCGYFPPLSVDALLFRSLFSGGILLETFDLSPEVVRAWSHEALYRLLRSRSHWLAVDPLNLL